MITTDFINHIFLLFVIWKKQKTIWQQPETVEDFCKKCVLKNFAKFTGKHLCKSLFFNKVAGFIKKETPVQVFPCEFWENKNTYFVEHMQRLLHKKFMQRVWVFDKMITIAVFNVFTGLCYWNTSNFFIKWRLIFLL